MVKRIEELDGLMRRTASDIGEAVTILVRDVATEAGRVAAESTRVDTGRARSNWVMSLGSPFSGEIPPYAPGSKLGIGERANLQGVLNQHQSVVRLYDAKRDAGGLHLANNVPYIGFLNDGGRNSAPDSMVEKAGQAAEQLVARARIVRR